MFAAQLGVPRDATQRKALYDVSPCPCQTRPVIYSFLCTLTRGLLLPAWTAIAPASCSRSADAGRVWNYRGRTDGRTDSSVVWRRRDRTKSKTDCTSSTSGISSWRCVTCDHSEPWPNVTQLNRVKSKVMHDVCILLITLHIHGVKADDYSSFDFDPFLLWS